MNDPQSIGQILWSTDAATQRAIWLVLGLAVVTAITVFVPLGLRLLRLSLLERRLRALVADAPPGKPEILHEDFTARLLDSPIQTAYEEFERRWGTARLSEHGERAPIRLIDIFDERPLLPFGPRRSLIPVLPGLFLALGVFAALIGLIPSLGEAGARDLTPEARTTLLTLQLGLALRTTAWGFLCAMGASLTGRLIVGAFEARSHGLDEVVESAFGSVSPGELAELTRQGQQRSIDTLGRELTQFADELNERLDRGLQRIEQSTARSANLVSQEQRGALHSVVQELSLSVRQGVEHHLGELRGALQRAVEHQSSVTGGLAETFQRMVENSKTQERVARTLVESASAVQDAARAMQGTTGEMQPVLEHLGSAGSSLEKTADRINETQQVVARSAEGVRSALEHAATGVDDQRQFIELSLGEIRRALVGLGDGLGDSLQRSLREVDDVLGKTVGQLRDTLAESNETIDRLSSPIRSAEGATREIHLALDRARSEVEALGQWMSQAAKPLRSGLIDVEGRAEEISRAMGEFNNHARQIDKTMEALRHEIHEESRRLQGSGSELGRRLQQASDAVGQLESTTHEAARRTRRDAGASAPRERHWAPSPSDRDPLERGRTMPSDPGFGGVPRDAAPQDTAPYDARSETSAPGPADPNETTAPGGLGEEAAGEARREAGSSGFRLGAPRAQGPDPYSRFEGSGEPPENVRHFPTPERELGEGLKLSGLLGPRGTESSDGQAEDGAPGSEPNADSDDRSRSEED